MLCFIALCYIVLCCIIFCSVILYCNIFYCIVVVIAQVGTERGIFCTLYFMLKYYLITANVWIKCLRVVSDVGS